MKSQNYSGVLSLFAATAAASDADSESESESAPDSTAASLLSKMNDSPADQVPRSVFSTPPLFASWSKGATPCNQTTTQATHWGGLNLLRSDRPTHLPARPLTNSLTRTPNEWMNDWLTFLPSRFIVSPSVTQTRISFHFHFIHFARCPKQPCLVFPFAASFCFSVVSVGCSKFFSFRFLLEWFSYPVLIADGYTALYRHKGNGVFNSKGFLNLFHY